MLDWIQVFVGLLGALGLLLIGLGVLALAKNARRSAAGAEEEHHITVRDLGKVAHKRAHVVREAVMGKDALKDFDKQRKRELKEQQAAKDGKDRVYVVSFNGDLQASQTQALREVVNALVPLLRKDRDEVVVRLESPGGVVHGYGLASNQLLRLRESARKLTVCVDKVAASGGYMMACLGHEVVAAPFAIVGSIGVLAGVPNFNRLIKDNKVDYFELTAGKFKRTLSLLGEVTDEKVHKLQEQLEDIHALFKDHVKKARPHMDLERVATGEYWHAIRALELGLVDRLATSDEVIAEALVGADVYEVTTHEKETLKAKLLGRFFGSLARRGTENLWAGGAGIVPFMAAGPESYPD
ncbi:MAG: protease SohB [Burkholderiaceae bacterium]